MISRAIEQLRTSVNAAGVRKLSGVAFLVIVTQSLTPKAAASGSAAIAGAALKSSTAIPATKLISNTIYTMTTNQIKIVASVSLIAAIPIGIQWKQNQDLKDRLERQAVTQSSSADRHGAAIARVAETPLTLIQDKKSESGAESSSFSPGEHEDHLADMLFAILTKESKVERDYELSQFLGKLAAADYSLLFEEMRGKSDLARAMSKDHSHFKTFARTWAHVAPAKAMEAITASYAADPITERGIGIDLLNQSIEEISKVWIEDDLAGTLAWAKSYQLPSTENGVSPGNHSAIDPVRSVITELGRSGRLTEWIDTVSHTAEGDDLCFYLRRGLDFVEEQVEADLRASGKRTNEPDSEIFRRAVESLQGLAADAGVGGELYRALGREFTETSTRRDRFSDWVESLDAPVRVPAYKGYVEGALYYGAGLGSDRDNDVEAIIETINEVRDWAREVGVEGTAEAEIREMVHLRSRYPERSEQWNELGIRGLLSPPQR